MNNKDFKQFIEDNKAELQRVFCEMHRQEYRDHCTTEYEKTNRGER